jgi:hypothetical protein
MSAADRVSPQSPPPPNRRRSLWWLIALALLVLLAILLLSRGCGDDDDSGDGGGSTTATSAESASGALVADDENVLEHVNNEPLLDLAGEDVSANAVVVQSVVNAGAFWIGTNQQSRVLVEVEDDDEVTIILQAGDTVSFDGTIEENLEEETYGLRLEKDIQQFRDQGAHIRVQAGDLTTP